MLRLRSSVGRDDEKPAPALDHLSSVAEEGLLGEQAPAGDTRAAKEAQASLEAAVAAAEPEQVLEAPSKDTTMGAAAVGPKRVGSGGSGGGGSSSSGGGGTPATSSSANKAKRGWQNSAVRVTARWGGEVVLGAGRGGCRATLCLCFV